jgi:hypothetical protein
MSPLVSLRHAVLVRTLLHLDDCAVEQVQITATSRCACDLQDDIVVVDELRLFRLYHFNMVAAEPSERLHRCSLLCVFASVDSRISTCMRETL